MPKIKGKATGKYTQRLYKHYKVDIFIANENNWGLIFAIRTGSADYSYKILASTWKKLGYESKGGILYKDGKPTYIREEKELFDLLGIKCIPPKYREIYDSKSK